MSTFKIGTLAILSLIATLGPLSAVAQEPVWFSIPFGFTVGPKSLGAGVYSVCETHPHILQIQSRDGRSNFMVLTTVSEPVLKQGLGAMTFQRYGDRYFLEKVSNPNRGWIVPQSGDEKRVIAAAARHAQPAKQLDVVASSRP